MYLRIVSCSSRKSESATCCTLAAMRREVSNRACILKAISHAGEVVKVELARLGAGHGAVRVRSEQVMHGIGGASLSEHAYIHVASQYL